MSASYKTTSLGLFELSLSNSARYDRMKYARGPVAVTSADPNHPGVLRLRVGNEHEALIDADDLPLVEKHCWYLYRGPTAQAYARTQIFNGVRTVSVALHRLLMMAGPSLVVDHINGNGLDNRKCNLRACTFTQNLWNSKRSARNKSGVKGVRQVGSKWHAQVTAGGVVCKERFVTADEACKWVEEKRLELHQEFARHA